MPKFFVQSKQIKNKEIEIIDQDVKHIKDVLRAKIGEEIEICNIEKEKTYKCEIIKLEKEKITTKIIEEIKEKIEPNTKVTIFQGIPKLEKMELIIQKSIELGVFEITPIETKRCIVKLNEKEKIKKLERWKKQSQSAAKQSGRNKIPKINNIINIKEVCKLIEKYDIFIVAYEKEKDNNLKMELKKLKVLKKDSLKIGILIGPEGGLEKKEIEELQLKGAHIITLGNRILRTETVALNILSILMYELEI